MHNYPGSERVGYAGNNSQAKSARDVEPMRTATTALGAQKATIIEALSDQLGNLNSVANVIGDRLESYLDRQLGSVPQPVSDPQEAPPSGLALQSLAQADYLRVKLDRIMVLLDRLDRL